MAKTKLFETAHANGVAQFLITGTGDHTIGLSGDDLTGAINTGTIESPLYADSQISITKLHWSGGVTITEGTAGVSFTLSGNGAWSQFNGWTPVDITETLTIANTETTGTLFIEVKKGKGYN